MQIRKLATAIGISICIGIAATASILATNLLTNGGFEAPFEQYGTYNGWKLQVAHGWEHFFVDANTYNGGSRLRFFSASDWAAFNNSPVVEHIEGSEAQVWWSSSTKKFDAGVYQRISGLTVGETYGFSAGILQVFETTNRTDPATGTMRRIVGIDPTGGTNPEASTVIWSPEEPHATFSTGGAKYTWFFPSVGITATSTVATVFVRVRSNGSGSTPHSDQVWADAAYFDVAPTTTLIINSVDSTHTQVVWHGSPRTGFHLFAYEAQYKKSTESNWTDIQIFDVLDGNNPPLETNATILVEPGIEYVVRARTWHEADGGNQSEVAGPWVEKTFISGSVLDGTLFNNTENAVSGVTIAVSGTATRTVSGADGQFSLVTGAGTVGITATTTTGWQSPSPVWADVPENGTAAITLTLRPPDDFIANGDMDGSLAGWQHTLTAPKFDTGAPRAGSASLCIPETAWLTATATVTDMYRPTLSFWMRVQGDGDDSLTAEIFVPGVISATGAVTITADSGWRHVFVPLDVSAIPGSGGSGVFPQDELYSGGIGVRFSAAQYGAPTEFCVDEISAGSQWGGVNRVFLPLVMKE